MNGAVVIDFGPDRGIRAFVEGDDDKVLFHCRGRSKWLSLDQLRDLEGVQYRITKRFLANGNKPANDLILAAVHVVHQIDSAGMCDQDGDRCLDAARKHLTAASTCADAQVAEHGRSLLSLIDTVASDGASSPRESVGSEPERGVAQR